MSGQGLGSEVRHTPPDVRADAEAKADGESWVDYAHRLERRIKEQRDHIKHLVELDKANGNRADRKRIVRLEAALGRAVLNHERQREATHALRAKLAAAESEQR